jgi:hypothetical protein
MKAWIGGEKNYGHLLPLHHDHDWCCLVTNAYTKLDHDQCCLITNAYTKLDHEHEHDKKKLWAPTNVWSPHHDDDPMLVSAYTKWELKLAMNTIKKICIKLSSIGMRWTKMKWIIIAMHHEKAKSQYNF